jgi:hypothetical protein
MSAPMSKKDFAFNAADRGFVPFPLGPNSDEPAFPQGDAMATKNKVMLRHWWDENPKYNVGFSLENLLTLRLTKRCPPETLEQLASLFKEHGVPKSVCTRRTRPDDEAIEICLHFSLPDGAVVEAKSDVFFAGIDLLSTDDFIVGPGSVIGRNVCAFVDDKTLSQASPWLLEVCGVQLPERKPMKVIQLKKPAAGPPVAVNDARVLPAAKTKLDWALEAALYIPVHPLRWYVDPGPDASPEQAATKAAKAALLHDWPNRATQDPQQIRELWTRWPDANIGGATNNLIVIDIDKRKDGYATFEALQLVYDFPETATTNTQGGGQHLLYVAPEGKPLKGGNDKLGQGIDVKAGGGYVLMPGSTIEGRAYTRANNRPMAFAPAWIVEKLKAAKPRTGAAGKRIVEEDDIARELAERWMLEHAPTAETGNIDNTTYKVAAKCYDFGCSKDTVLDIMLEWNETRCFPPQDIEDLERVVESAGRNRENAIGSLHPFAPGFEAVEIDKSRAPPLAPLSIETTALAFTDAASGWNEPTDLWVENSKPAALPSHVLPDLVERAARDRGMRLGVEAGAPAAALVTVLGSLVPAGNRLQMRQHDTEWTVKPIQWTAIIGQPGSNKSATIGYAVSAVQKLEGEWRKTFASAERNRKISESRRAVAAKTKPENSDQVFAVEPESEKPRFRQKLFNDATTEALAVALSENPEGLLYHADELAGWLGGMDAYRAKGGKDRPFWLQAKEGGPLTINRKTSERICVENCAISVLGGIQPDKIRALQLGMSDDGLLQRFAPIVIQRDGNGLDIPPDAPTVDQLALAAAGIAESENNILFRFSPEADAELHAIEAFKAKEIARPDSSSMLRQWLDKMPNEFGRLSLIFHFIEWYGSDLFADIGGAPATVISRGTAERARRYLTEFVYSHARVFYLKELGNSDMDEHALWIAGFVLSRELEAIEMRDIYRSYPALRATERRGQISSTMRILEMYDWVRPIKERKGVDVEWAINPAVHDGRFEKTAELERSRRGNVRDAIRQEADSRREIEAG